MKVPVFATLRTELAVSDAEIAPLMTALAVNVPVLVATMKAFAVMPPATGPLWPMLKWFETCVGVRAVG